MISEGGGGKRLSWSFGEEWEAVACKHVLNRSIHMPWPHVPTFWHSQTVFRDTWPGPEWQPPSSRQANTNLRLYARYKEREGWVAEREGGRSRFRVLQLSVFRFAGATDVLIKMLDKPLTRSSWRFHLGRAICSDLYIRWNGSRERRHDGVVAWLLINSYGNNGTSLYCQPASNSWRRLILFIMVSVSHSCTLYSFIHLHNYLRIAYTNIILFFIR